MNEVFNANRRDSNIATVGTDNPTAITGMTNVNGWYIDGTGLYITKGIEVSVTINKHLDRGISPILYFKYLKNKFKVLERKRFDERLRRLEVAFYKAVEAGQEALGMKLLKEIAVETRESAMYAKGIKRYVELADVKKHKDNIRSGHISDTKLEEFTRDIPARVMKKKKAVEDLFDGFVVYHYWQEERKDVKQMTPDEKSKMRDPVLFGTIKETDRLYFIADWNDELCDLSFEEMADAAGKYMIEKEPELAKKWVGSGGRR